VISGVLSSSIIQFIFVYIAGTGSNTVYTRKNDAQLIVLADRASVITAITIQLQTILCAISDISKLILPLLSRLLADDVGSNVKKTLCVEITNFILCYSHRM
jgi:hypothetical protein